MREIKLAVVSCCALLAFLFSSGQSLRAEESAASEAPPTATSKTVEERVDLLEKQVGDVKPASTKQAGYTDADLKTQASDAALAGHNAWMLTSAALVLFMTA